MNDASLDMLRHWGRRARYGSGETGSTGAMPPAGTSSFHFLGVQRSNADYHAVPRTTRFILKFFEL
jgi:hypothetical protein